MSMYPEILRLSSVEAGLLQSVLPRLNPAQQAEVEALITGLPETESPELSRLRNDPACLLADKTPDPWQAELLRGEGRRLLLLCSRQSGKSTVAAALALRHALLTPGSLVLLLSPTLRQSGELFRDKVLRLYNALNRPVATVQESALTVGLANGSRIISLPGDEETIRGYSGVSLLVIDEAARVSDELYRAVRPMLAVSGGRLVALSTPFGKKGWFYNEWHGSGAWERVRITARQCPRIAPEFLEEERRALGPEWYAQEYECDFTSSAASPLFPSEWLVRAEQLAASLQGQPRQAKAIGVDPGEGKANTAWAVVDEQGLIHLLSMKTPDTSVIRGQTLALMRTYRVPAKSVLFDRGGGGRQIADDMRRDGYAVQTVAFGEAVSLEPRRGVRQLREQLEHREESYAYKKRRGQMYGELRLLLDPAGKGFAIPAEYVELHRQLAAFPLRYDGEGRLELPPKSRRTPDDTRETLMDMLGCSPDESDALVLAVHGLQTPRRVLVGAI